MKTVPLTKGFSAVVDDEDFDRVNQHAWWYQKAPHSNVAYARTQIGKRKILMHCFILGTKGIDHKNGDGLDNRKENLRLTTVQGNNANRKVQKNNQTTGVKGVYFDSRRNCYRARITINRKTKHLGNFVTLKEAAESYNNAAIELFGEFALLNEI